jgi:hypothetical protein
VVLHGQLEINELVGFRNLLMRCKMVVAMTCFVVAFASSVITADIVGVEREFNVSEELALASISLFVVGFGLGMFENY